MMNQGLTDTSNYQGTNIVLNQTAIAAYNLEVVLMLVLSNLTLLLGTRL